MDKSDASDASDGFLAVDFFIFAYIESVSVARFDLDAGASALPLILLASQNTTALKLGHESFHAPNELTGLLAPSRPRSKETF